MSANELLERFPALHRLRLSLAARRIPFVQQLAATECGTACLTMVLGYLGKTVRLEAVRALMGLGRDGVTALAILNAASYFGLRGRGVRIEVEDLKYLEPGTILHWEFNHFVVFAALHADGAEIVDPAYGRRLVPLAQLQRSFTGVALLLEPGEGFTKEDTRGGHLLRYLRQVLSQSDRLPRILVTSLMVQVFALGLPVLTGALVDRVVPRGDYHLLAVLAAGLSMLVGFHFLASMIRAHLLLHMRTHLDARMTLGFLDHLVELPYAFFQRRSAGDLMMRLNSNSTVREILTAGSLSGLLDGTLVVLYLLILLAANLRLGVLVAGLGAAQLLVFVFSRRRQKELLSQDLETQARSQSYQVELFSGIETLKAMGGEHRAVEHWSHLFVDVLNLSLARGRLAALLDSLNSTLRLLSPLLILGYGALQVLGEGMSLGIMLGLSALAQGFLGPLGSLVGTFGQLELLRSYIERISDVMDTPPEQDRTKVRPAGALRGEIALERVSFQYGPAAPPVVRDVSLTIEPGHFVALVGRSGSGKSTLASLLLGLYQPTSGRILYDGTDLAELDLGSVRRQLGIVTQKPYLFGTTIRSNIAFSDPQAPLEAVVDAAQRARLHDEIMAMPMRYETLLIDQGASLSGGQRQRLALARALLRSPAILLLDEATSALDAVTEAEVLAELAKLRCTRIVIAHRLSTIVNADLILVMEEGRVAERGTHAQLLQQGGVYARLVAAQVGGATPDPVGQA